MTNITPEGLSAHDHGNCELCDKIERELAAALEELARLKAPVEVEGLVAELPEHLAQMARFTLATGLRRANVTGLEWGNLDLARRVAWIWPDEA